MTSATATTPAAASSPPPATARPLAPGLSGASVARQLLKIRRDPLRAFDDLMASHGPVVRLSGTGVADTLFIADPADVKQVLITNQDNYEKGSQYEVLRRILGNGLVTSDGTIWRQDRSIAQPRFARRALTPFAAHMAAAADGFLDRWETEWRDGDRVEIGEHMSALTLDIVGRALVGADFSARASEFGEALYDLLGASGEIGRSPITQIGEGRGAGGVARAMRLQPARTRRIDRALETLDEVVLETIARRRGGNEQHDDLLGDFMGFRDDAGQPLPDQLLRDELMTFVTAGHETTSNALTWLWVLLSQHPEARDRLVAEVDEVLGGATPDIGVLESLPWTTACIQEAMRLYPPVWIVQRRALGDDVLGGYHVPAGTIVAVSPWVVHRRAETWPNPAGFDPRRFLGDAPKQRDRLAYIPFLAGRRVCIGQGFAMLEATILTAMIAQRWTLDLVPDARIYPETTITLRPLGGAHFHVRRRA